jgi:hypothetical protein
MGARAHELSDVRHEDQAMPKDQRVEVRSCSMMRRGLGVARR